MFHAIAAILLHGARINLHMKAARGRNGGLSPIPFDNFIISSRIIIKLEMKSSGSVIYFDYQPIRRHWL